MAPSEFIQEVERDLFALQGREIDLLPASVVQFTGDEKLQDQVMRASFSYPGSGTSIAVERQGAASSIVIDTKDGGLWRNLTDKDSTGFVMKNGKVPEDRISPGGLLKVRLNVGGPVGFQVQRTFAPWPKRMMPDDRSVGLLQQWGQTGTDEGNIHLTHPKFYSIDEGGYVPEANERAPSTSAMVKRISRGLLDSIQRAYAEQRPRMMVTVPTHEEFFEQVRALPTTGFEATQGDDEELNYLQHEVEAMIPLPLARRLLAQLPITSGVETGALLSLGATVVERGNSAQLERGVRLVGMLKGRPSFMLDIGYSVSDYNSMRCLPEGDIASFEDPEMKNDLIDIVHRVLVRAYHKT